MKLLIDIPKDLYDMTRTPNNVNYIMRMAGFICSAIANGTPLDDVIGKIDKAYDDLDGYDPYALGTFANMVSDILDNIGKAESEG